MDPSQALFGSDEEQVRRLQEVSALAEDEEAVLRLIAVSVLPSNRPLFGGEEGSKTSLPPVAQAREAIADADFRVQDTIAFERCYFFKGSVAAGKSSAQALETVRASVRGVSAGGPAELFLQPTKDGQSIIVMLLEEDLPQKEVEAWNWLVFAALLLVTLFAANTTTLAVVSVSQSMMNAAATDPDTSLRILQKLFPTAAGIIATVGAAETARRVAAGAYGVQLSPPYLVPAWPIPSVGCLTAVTRRLTPAPNKESELAMSVAASVAGLVVSLAFVAYGLALGPETDVPVSLAYQQLPLVLKALLRPLLGAPSASIQPDPFLDPVNIAFPANPFLIGGICGLVITSLSLLPIGRLDGGVLARNVLGTGPAAVAGFFGLGLLVAGSFSADDVGSLYLSFGVASLIWQSGAELPPLESTTDAPDGFKVAGAALLALGFALCIPGWAFPQV